MDYTFNGRPKSYFWVYELDVKQELPTWPEMRVRERRWVNDKMSWGTEGEKRQHARIKQVPSIVQL